MIIICLISIVSMVVGEVVSVGGELKMMMWCGLVVSNCVSIVWVCVFVSNLVFIVVLVFVGSIDRCGMLVCIINVLILMLLFVSVLSSFGLLVSFSCVSIFGLVMLVLISNILVLCLVVIDSVRFIV